MKRAMKERNLMLSSLKFKSDFISIYRYPANYCVNKVNHRKKEDKKTILGAFGALPLSTD